MYALFRLAFARTPDFHILNQPRPMSRRLILPKARGQVSKLSHSLSAYDFMFYVNSLSQGSLSPFPRGTCSLSVIQEYLALRGGPR